MIEYGGYVPLVAHLSLYFILFLHRGLGSWAIVRVKPRPFQGIYLMMLRRFEEDYTVSTYELLEGSIACAVF